MINIYEYTNFELRNEIRNKNFRFVRYTGRNYNQLRNYIEELSPSTRIWDEKFLKKGYYYSFLSRDRSFQEIPEYELRACIASNPFLIENDQPTPIYISREDAIEYLKQSGKNRIFPYDVISETYAYDESKNSFVVYDTEHHRGLSIDSLPFFSEWYACIDDKLYLVSDSITPKYSYSSHQVHLDFGLRDKADRIIFLIYEINKISVASSDNRCIFNPAWEDPMRYRTLYRTCLNESRFKDFLTVLYNYVYEETKSNNRFGKHVARELLPDSFKYDDFVIHVGEFRNFYFHGQSEYCSQHLSGPELFTMYINMPFPRGESDYEILQVGLLTSFIEFLNRLKEYVSRNLHISGIICSDEDDNIHCGDVLLPMSMISWVGHNCRITSRTNNNISSLVQKYPFYCQFPLIEVEINGVLAVGSNNDIIYGHYSFGKGLEYFVGWHVLIKRIMPYANRGKVGSSGEPIWYVDAFELIKPISGVSYIEYVTNMLSENMNYIETDICNADIFIFERNNGGWKLVGLKCTIRNNVLEAEKNSAQDNIIRGPIEKDEQGFYHVKNVLLPTQFAIPHIGLECEVMSHVKCKKKSGKIMYEYFSNDVKLLKGRNKENTRYKKE